MPVVKLDNGTSDVTKNYSRFQEFINVIAARRDVTLEAEDDVKILLFFSFALLRAFIASDNSKRTDQNGVSSSFVPNLCQGRRDMRT